jgi:hypothetical protein
MGHDALHNASHTDGTDDIQSAGAAQKGLIDTEAQTLAGVKTFSSFPVTPSSDPTTDYQVTNKAYVDASIGAGASIQLNWKFSTSITAADPGSKSFKYDNATPASVTNLYVNDITESGADAGAIIGKLSVGDNIYLQQTDTSGAFILVSISGAVVDNTGWWTIPVTVVDSGVLPANNKNCGFILLFTVPDAHASTHSDGGSDEVTVENLATSSTDTSTALRPDGAGGLVFSDVAIADTTGTLAVARGGTNATDVATAQQNLDLEPGVDVQVYDAGLQSISGLTTAADKMVYTTASDTYAVTDLTSFARTILDDADEATFKATVNLEIGTDVQAWSSVLDATTASFLVADETKLDFISVTQAVDLDALETASHVAVTVSDTAEIDFTLTGQQISASIVAASIDETKLDTSVNASLDLADSALQSGDIGVTVQGYDADTAKYDDTTANFTGTLQNGGSDVIIDTDIGSTVQAYDAGLQSISGLTTAADKMVYTTASDTYAVTDLTSFARTILDDADASTVRTTIGAASTTHASTHENGGGDEISVAGLSGILADNQNSIDVTQATHGLAIEDVIYNNAGTWTKAQSDDRTTLGIAIVTAVADTSNFTYVSLGNATFTSHGYTVGSYLYVSEATAGLLTETEPTGITEYSNPIAYVADANTLIILPFRPSDALIRSNDHRIASTSTTPYNVTDIDEIVNVDATTASATVNLPTPSADYTGFTLIVKKVDSTANTVTVKSSSGNVDGVAGTTGKVLTSQYDSLTFVCDATDYWII